MTDRELLEAAAKAAGVDAKRLECGGPNWQVWLPEQELWVRGWNPLKDDGDAMRLATRLSAKCCGLALWLSASGITVDFPLGPDIETDEEAEDHGGDLNAAARRAIVRAAAEIGSLQ